MAHLRDHYHHNQDLRDYFLTRVLTTTGNSVDIDTLNLLTLGEEGIVVKETPGWRLPAAQMRWSGQKDEQRCPK